MQQYTTLILIALMVVAFYFLIMRPQKKRQQAIQKTMNELQPGTRVMLGSGLFGTLVSVGTKQVVLEVSPGVEMTVLKQAIARTVAPGDEDTEFDELEEYDDSEVIADEPSVEPSSVEPSPIESSPIESSNETRPQPPPPGSAGADQRPSSAS
jgi:preprotein translocase subunit YajC